MKRAFRSTLCISLALLSYSVQGQRVDLLHAGAVRVEGGFVGGEMSADNSVMVFKGIPYAAPPVGELRWQEPQALKPWKGVRNARHFGPSAMQGKPVPFGVYTEEFLIPQDGLISEDCLYLNIWSAAKTRHEFRPVLVYIHGGGFMAGSGSVPIYDGVAMAKKGIIFITINYRLGPFGFFAHPTLSKESPHHSSGNYGIMDQIAALKWIRRNIDAFGGDPENITIAGQSAGSMSVNVLSVSPVAQGLFTKMIAESGASIIPGRFGGSLPLDSAEARGLAFQKSIGAADLDALRAMPADSLLAAYKGSSQVIVDHYILPEAVSTLFAKGRQSNLPLLTGFNADDISSATPNSLAEYKQQVQEQFGADAVKVLQWYPASNDEQARRAGKDLNRDRGFGIQNFSWAVLQSHYGQFKTWMYYFTRKVPENNGAHQYGAFHTGEVMYAYNTLPFLNRPLENEDRDLAKIMSSYWANFTKTGDPNAAGLPVWPAFDERKGQTMVLDVKPEGKRHPQFNGLAFFFERDMPQD